MSTRILVIYDTNQGNCYRMAQHIGRGVASVDGAEAVIRRVPKVTSKIDERDPPVPDDGAPYATVEQLAEHDGLILGGPTHFGNMSASLKHYLDETVTEWVSGALVGKPAGVFTSTGSLHGGQETTLVSMMLPLLHHGMLIVGLPYTHQELNDTTSGGTPYGPSHLAGAEGERALDDTEAALCRALGKRVADTATRLAR